MWIRTEADSDEPTKRSQRQLTLFDAHCVTIAARPSLDFLYKQWIKCGVEGDNGRTAVGGKTVTVCVKPAKTHTHPVNGPS